MASFHRSGQLSQADVLLLGCGVLRKEIGLLIKENDWPVETHFLEPSLHDNAGELSAELISALALHRHRNSVVFYGCCHPCMDDILAVAGTSRTAGQNCVEMLLGKEVFDRELKNGAYFLLECWAAVWTAVIPKTLGTSNLDVIRDIFRVDKKYLLCLRTPCSEDFTRDAESAGAMAGLPIRWMDTPLDNLEAVLRTALLRKMEALQWRKEEKP